MLMTSLLQERLLLPFKSSLPLSTTPFHSKTLANFISSLVLKLIGNQVALFSLQTKYANQILCKASLTSAKPQPTPMATSLKLTPHGSEAFLDPTLYRQTVGALQYLTFTRPDLTYAVNKVSQFMHQPQLPSLASGQTNFKICCWHYSFWHPFHIKHGSYSLLFCRC